VTSIVPSASMKASLEESTTVYEKQLLDHPDAMTYLVDQRGLSPALVSELRLGYVETPLVGDGWFKNHISIPYITPSGVVGMKYRALDDSRPKYKKREGEINRIYNTSILKTAYELVICEGEFNAMACLEVGLNAVALNGTGGWKPEFRRIFRNRKITVLCDGDEPGKKLGAKLAAELWDATIVECPDDEDPNSILVKYGPEGLRELVLG
jgi:DNA primase